MPVCVTFEPPTMHSVPRADFEKIARACAGRSRGGAVERAERARCVKCTKRSVDPWGSDGTAGSRVEPLARV